MPGGPTTELPEASFDIVAAQDEAHSFEVMNARHVPDALPSMEEAHRHVAHDTTALPVADESGFGSTLWIDPTGRRSDFSNRPS